MFGGICALTSYRFSLFEWQKAFFDIKILITVHVRVWRSGRMESQSSGGQWFAPRLCFYRFQQKMTNMSYMRKFPFGGNVNLGKMGHIFTVHIFQDFTLYLRNCRRLNLRAIENCICGLRSIERNMRFILRTVWL